MSQLENIKLRSEAMKAYELGRARLGAQMLIFTLPLTALSLLICGRPVASLALGVALTALAAWATWKGRGYDRAVLPGMLAGGLAFVPPALLHLTGLCCKYDFETLACLMSGVLVGALMGKWAATRDLSFPSERLVLTGVPIAALTGAMGCTSLGVAAAFGLGVGIIAVGASVFLLQRSAQVQS